MFWGYTIFIEPIFQINNAASHLPLPFDCLNSDSTDSFNRFNLNSSPNHNDNRYKLSSRGITPHTYHVVYFDSWIFRMLPFAEQWIQMMIKTKLTLERRNQERILSGLKRRIFLFRIDSHRIAIQQASKWNKIVLTVDISMTLDSQWIEAMFEFELIQNLNRHPIGNYKYQFQNRVATMTMVRCTMCPSNTLDCRHQLPSLISDFQ